ncbi:NAD(P)H-binding protein [Streptomyces sp. WMMC500]|uniref:NAD(P)H-binding protein n=1 Tax=Streptomyces sp. WMMC500 TaxID=3015154 RepID=UPI00248CA7AD|nr:NAD(P)H-binding protein [Streptomyces sp. WMMC500]WBB63335.1 NAD(P)H-binding protein [Streptomyces sp. WMMC500]
MILVTGATGNVGGQAVAQVEWAGVPVRALVRDPARADLPPGVEAVRGDLADPATLGPAFAGVSGLLLVWPLPTAETAPAVLDAAVAAGVRRIAYVSAWGASDDPDEEPEGILGFHTAIERLIRASPLEWTLLRAGGFAANTLHWADQIRTGDVVRAPYARAGRSLIHEADVAAVGIRALTHPGHASATYHLTGPETLTQAEQVRTIGDALGRDLRFEEAPPAVAREAYVAAGLPPSFADGILAGQARLVTDPEPVTHTVAEVTGHKARTFAQWARDHAADFGG